MENGAFAGINDFINSFEPPCYFSKLVKRVLKLFIPKAWIDHIAWGHDNTLVGGILVSAYSLTFIRPKPDSKDQKLIELCQICSVFVFLNMQVRILWKGQKKCKNDITSTRFGKSSKSRSRERNFSEIHQRFAHMVKVNLGKSKNNKNGPWILSWKNGS